jgi:hypothetical protein
MATYVGRRCLGLGIGLGSNTPLRQSINNALKFDADGVYQQICNK